MKVAGVLGLGRGHMDDGPDTDLSVVVADEHTEELAGVDAVSLEATPPAIDLDGGGVDDEVEGMGLALASDKDLGLQVVGSNQGGTQRSQRSQRRGGSSPK